MAIKFDTKSVYFLKQKCDIAKYGKKKKVKRFGVPFSIVQYVTPNRRLSNRPVKLSNPQFFIDNFMKEKGRNVCPMDWEKYSEQQKVDYIVKERYSQLIANKIMNVIKDMPVEYHFSADMNGELVSCDIGNDEKISPKKFRAWFNHVLEKNLINQASYTSTTVHNHPEEVRNIAAYVKEHHQENMKKMGSPFSGGDLQSYFFYGSRGYVVDAYGHKYKYVPFRQKCAKSSIADKINIFLCRMFDVIQNNINETDKKLDELLKRIDKGEWNLDIRNELMEAYYLFLTHDSKNVHARADALYALSDYGKMEQLK